MPPELHDWIVDSLRGGWRLEAVFDSARQWILKGGPSELPTLGADEQEAAAYWERFDKITESLEDRYLAYIEKVSADLFERILNNPQDTSEIGPAFDRHLADFQAALVGSADEPGLLAKLHTAGQAAGAYLLAGSGKGATPARAAVDVDFKARFDQAVNYARFQSAQLVTNINSVNRFGIMQAVAKAIEESWPRDRLYRELTKYLTPPGEKPSKQITARAKVIGDTEKIMSYNAGALEQFKAGGVKRAKWSTVSVGEPRICKICSSLHGLEADIDQGWYSERTKKFYKLSAHPRCRCFRVPVKRAVSPAKPAAPAQQGPIDPDSQTLQEALDSRRAEYERLADQLVNVASAAKSKIAAAQQEITRAQDKSKAAAENVQELHRVVLKTKQFRDWDSPEFQAWNDIDLENENRAKAAVAKWEKDFPVIAQRNPAYAKQMEIDYYRQYHLASTRTEVYQNALTPEYRAAQEAHKAALEQHKAAQDEVAKVRKKSEKVITKNEAEVRQAQIESLTGRTAGLGGKLSLTSGLVKGNKDNIGSAENWLGRLFSKPLPGVTDKPIPVDGIRGRAYAQPGRMFLTNKDVKDSTLAHEYGHVIEFAQPQVMKRCIEFLYARASSTTPVSMNVLTGNKGYRSDEIGFRGNYLHPYVGKVYRRGGQINATEVFSMGIEYMFKDAEKFRKDDPEYFNFILMLIRDYL